MSALLTASNPFDELDRLIDRELAALMRRLPSAPRCGSRRVRPATVPAEDAEAFIAHSADWIAAQPDPDAVLARLSQRVADLLPHPSGPEPRPGDNLSAIRSDEGQVGQSDDQDPSSEDSWGDEDASALDESPVMRGEDAP